MNLLDAMIALLIVGAAISGWRRGISWVGFSFAGLLVGTLIGAAIAPPIARHFGDHAPSTEALIGTGVFLGCVALLQGAGTAVGYRFRVAALRTEFAELDSGLGSGLAAIGVLVAAWFLGLTFSQFQQFPQLADELQGSGVLRALDDVAPRPPGFLAQLGSLLRGEAFPNPFASLGQGTQFAPVQLPTPADIKTAGVTTAADGTGRIISSGNCGTEAGSAFPFSGDLWATNAHVVAGGRSFLLSLPNQEHEYPATVVYFNPDVDIAVLDVRGTGVKPFKLSPGDPQTGTKGAVIGYPGGGDESVVEAGVKGVETADGRDIYGGGLVTRQIEVLQASVIPGNSGGPIVDLSGNVIGVVFAASTTVDNEGYALAPSTYVAILKGAEHNTVSVDTGDCAN